MTSDMKFYADYPGRRALQVAGDVVTVVWVVTMVKLAGAVHDAALTLAAPGERMASAGTGLAAQLREAGAAVADIPLVGDQVAAPFEGAGDAADRIARAGTAQAAAAGDLAFWLAVVTATVPVLIVLAVYLPGRWRFVREATAGQRFMDGSADLDLFALRAMANQPMHRLARISDDPAGAWRRGDPQVVFALAELELKNAGMRPPPGPVSAVPARTSDGPGR
jgi:hypothetical protein